MYEAKRDLVTLGAYTHGSDPALDEALVKVPRIEAFLQQEPSERVPFATAIASLLRAVI